MILKNVDPVCRGLMRAIIIAVMFITAGCDQSAAPTGGSRAQPAGDSGDRSPAAAVDSAAETGARPVADDARPLIEFETLAYDFGVMSETETRSGALTFTNTGNAPLVIEDIKPTCGCTAVELQKKTYAPGESGSISVVFDPSGPNEPGKPQRKYVNVLSNAANASSGVTSVAILADVQAFIDMQPRFLQINEVRLGQPYHADITVTGADTELVIESVEPTNPHIRVEVLDPPRDSATDSQPTDGRRPTKTRIIRVHVSPDAPWGNLFSWLTVTITGRPAPDAELMTHTARIRIQGQVFGELAADPDTFRFGVLPGEPFEREMFIESRDNLPFQITGATAQCTAATSARVETEQLSPVRWRVVLKATGGAGPAPARGVVTLTTTVSGPESTLEIPIIGVVRPAD